MLISMINQFRFKSVDIDEEIATLVLPDHLLAEVKELVDILYNKKAPRAEGVVPQIFKSLGFNDIQSSTIQGTNIYK